MADIKLVPVRILVDNLSPYVKDDVAGLPSEDAAKLIEMKLGEAVKPEAKASAQKSE